MTTPSFYIYSSNNLINGLNNPGSDLLCETVRQLYFNLIFFGLWDKTFAAYID